MGISPHRLQDFEKRNPNAHTRARSVPHALLPCLLAFPCRLLHSSLNAAICCVESVSSIDFVAQFESAPDVVNCRSRVTSHLLASLFVGWKRHVDFRSGNTSESRALELIIPPDFAPPSGLRTRTSEVKESLKDLKPTDIVARNFLSSKRFIILEDSQ